MMWDRDGDGVVSLEEFVDAMLAIDRSTSGKSNRGYAGEMIGLSSAAYSSFGVALYRADTGALLAVEDYPNDFWIKFQKEQNGVDSSPAVQEASDSEKSYPLAWMRTTFVT